MNLNTGQLWSEVDERDLRWSLAHGRTVEETANFLCRDVDEVEAKMREVGLKVAAADGRQAMVDLD